MDYVIVNVLMDIIIIILEVYVLLVILFVELVLVYCNKIVCLVLSHWLIIKMNV